ncbi:uncharacterized protein [Euwallacea similis]|uniref:uncharacterized protein isoform X1 n=1 Tax=Euwallacea similis TaxID=1736056 RepID=UPI00344EA989
MLNLKTILVLSAVFVVCYGQHINGYNGFNKCKKSHHHHHGIHHFHFLYYLTFLAIKLKIIFFVGTLFTVSLVAGKVIGIIKFIEYMKSKDRHEEKVVYVNPHEHHDHEFESQPWASRSEFYESKSYEGYPAEYSGDHPPEDVYDHNERYGFAPGTYHNGLASSRSSEDNYTAMFYRGITVLTNRLRQLNITDMALNDMGIKDINCKRKFVCKADFNAHENIILKTGLNILRDASYRRYMPNSTVTSEEECNKLYPECSSESEL